MEFFLRFLINLCIMLGILLGITVAGLLVILMVKYAPWLLFFVVVSIVALIITMEQGSTF